MSAFVRVTVIPAVLGLAVFAAILLPHPAGGLSWTRFIVGCVAWQFVAVGGSVLTSRLISRRSAP